MNKAIKKACIKLLHENCYLMGKLKICARRIFSDVGEGEGFSK